MFNRMIHFRKDNKGSSYVLVISAIALISILVTIVFTLVSMLFMTQSLSRRNKENFYYIEKALDEMKTGVGNTCLQILNTAYEDTVSQVVYYDENKKKYMVKSSEVANTLMKEEFIDLVGQEYLTSDDDALHDLLDSFISIKTEDGGTIVFEPVATSGFSFQEVQTKAGAGGDIVEGYSFKNIMVSRTDSKGNTQSITTDIDIMPPEFDVNFLSSANSVDTLFSYSIIADYGIEIDGTGTESIAISGNVFAGLDNGRNNMIKTRNVAGTIVDVNAKDGSTKASKYSGIYVSNAQLTLQSNTVICPGYLTACGNTKINTSAKAEVTSRSSKTDLWVDNIVTIDDASSAKTPQLYLNAKCNVADDLELNAEKSNVTIDGTYYGYRLGLNRNDNKSSKDHGDSSSIVVNGKKSTLNLSKLSALVVSGNSYVDLKKEANGDTPNTMNGNAEVKDYRTGESISTKGNQLAYRVDSADYELKTKLDADGNVVKDADNNTVKEVVGADLKLFLKYKKWYDSLSTAKKDAGVYMITDEADLEGYETFVDYINGKYSVDGNDYNNTVKNHYHMLLTTSGASAKVVAYYIKNEYYYFFEFDDSEAGRAGKTQFALDYSRYVKALSGVREDYTSNDVFPVEQIVAPTNLSSDSYTSGAITTKDETKDNVEIKNPIGTMTLVDTRNLYYNKSYSYNLLQFMLATDEALVTEYNKASAAQQAQKQYKNIVQANLIASSVASGIPYFASIDNGVTTRNVSYQSLSPLMYYVNWDWTNLTWGDSVTAGPLSDVLINPSSPEGKTSTGAYIWVQEDDVIIDGNDLTGSSNSTIKGICICKGNVTIRNLKRFDGLIIAAGKVYLPESCTIVANEESMGNLLDNDVEKFDASDNHVAGTGVLRKILGLEPIKGESKEVEPGVDVSVIDASSLVGYQNWIKNGSGSSSTVTP